MISYLICGRGLGRRNKDGRDWFEDGRGIYGCG